MRATDGLQTTINLGPVHRDDQAFSLQLSLGMSLPVPSQDEHSFRSLRQINRWASGLKSAGQTASEETDRGSAKRNHAE